MDASLDPYPDGLLAKLSAMGVSGVWLHVGIRSIQSILLCSPGFDRESGRLHVFTRTVIPLNSSSSISRWGLFFRQKKLNKQDSTGWFNTSARLFLVLHSLSLTGY